MATFGGFDFTTLRGVNLKNTAAIRLQGDGGFHSTLSMQSGQEADREIIFADKNGLVGVTGTLSVDMPAIGAGAYSETLVSATGLRVEDAVVATLQNAFNTVTTDRGNAVLVGAQPAADELYLTFFNFGATATIPNTVTVAYTAAR